MGKRIFEPDRVNDDYKTVVTISPSFEIITDGLISPSAFVEIEYFVKKSLRLRAKFEKVISDEVYSSHCDRDRNVDAVLSIAEDMINGDLSKTGLAGLVNLDMYKIISSDEPLRALNQKWIERILTECLGVQYSDEETTREVTYVPSKDEFYNLEVLTFAK